MKPKFYDTLPEPLYQEIYNISDRSIYHTKEWHRFLQGVYGVPVSVFLIQASNLFWALPVMKRRTIWNTVKFECLPLSHKVGPIFSGEPPEELSFSPEINLKVHDSISGRPGRSICDYFLTRLNLRDRDFNSWQTTLPTKSIQYMLKRAERESLDLVTEISKRTISDFYELMVQTRHRQGSPVYPSNFFTKLYDHLGSNMLNLYLAYKDQTPISGCIVLKYNRTAIYGYSASSSDARYRTLGGGELCLFNAIKDAFSNDYDVFDFGSTPRMLPQLRSYKEKWGGVSHELSYTRYSDKAVGMNRNGSVVRAATKVFQWMPQSLFRVISPVIFKSI